MKAARDALKFHPLANIFPLIEGEEFASLVASIKENGLREPIRLFKNKIIDGRNRYRACAKAKVKPRFEKYEGTDPLGFIIDLNVRRRHLSESQRAMVAARLATLPQGARTDLSPIGEKSQAGAAALLNVGKRSVERARDVIGDGTTTLIAAVDSGVLPVSKAAQLTNASAEFQDAVIAKIKEDVAPSEAIRQVRAEIIAQGGVDAPTGKFRVIYADPPWQYGNTMPDEFKEQRDHYATMTLEDICAEPVKDWCEDDAVLFLWVTSPILEESFQVIEAWGFKYKASFVWDKVKHVMGHYNSVRHEFLLICTRGSCQPDVHKLFDSVVTIERTEHSRKPEEFYEIIETIYTLGRRLEMYARGERRGWKRHGHTTENAHGKAAASCPLGTRKASANIKRSSRSLRPPKSEPGTASACVRSAGTAPPRAGPGARSRRGIAARISAARSRRRRSRWHRSRQQRRLKTKPARRRRAERVT